jgi:hypothetical protein
LGIEFSRPHDPEDNFRLLHRNLFFRNTSIRQNYEIFEERLPLIFALPPGTWRGYFELESSLT